MQLSHTWLTEFLLSQSERVIWGICCSLTNPRSPCTTHAFINQWLFICNFCMITFMIKTCSDGVARLHWQSHACRSPPDVDFSSSAWAPGNMTEHFHCSFSLTTRLQIPIHVHRGTNVQEMAHICRWFGRTRWFLRMGKIIFHIVNERYVFGS